MPIIITTKEANVPQEQFLNIYPDQFVSDKKKQQDDFLKRNMDYFYTVAINAFSKNHGRCARNYEILKGVIRREDFYEGEEVKSFTETVMDSIDLPAYVQHYSIMTPVINTLVGEMSKRPDNTYVKAYDDDSKAEELEYKTQILNQFAMQKAKERIMGILAMQGQNDIDPQELQQMTAESVGKDVTSYTSVAERWGSRMIEALKVSFSMREKSEECFRDLTITAREFMHIYEDKSPMGFGIEVLNPKNVWWLTTPDEKYISDPLDKGAGSYAAGTIHIMELSEILHKFSLTDKEIEHLKEQSQQSYLINVRESNLVRPTSSSYGSITYDTYSPLIMQERFLMEAQLKENHDELDNFLGITNSAGTFGNKYMVVRAYWCSKKQIGDLKYLDEDGVERSMYVDENYVEGSHPGQTSLVWGWVNQWYHGLKIGPDIYYVKPFELLDYCPIIGSVFENKNAEPKSLVDLMKPFQTLYNLFMNKLWETAAKDWGNVILTNIRHVPTLKDGDSQDSLEQFEEAARARGIAYLDDSPENTKAPSSFNQHTVLKASRVEELRGYWGMAASMKQECWELVGLSRERVGSVAATQTATGTNTALSQSYAQTEPWFSHHEYFLNKVYQAMLDAALYIQSHKPLSTISYVSNEGEQCFVQVNGSDLKLKDLMVLVTSRAEDANTFKQLQQLAQPMLQNGASPYEVAQLYTTKSLRMLKDTFKANMEKMDKRVQDEQQQKQEEMKQKQQMFEQEQQLALQQKDKEMENDNMNKQLDRLSKEKIASLSKKGDPTTDSSDNDIALSKLEQESERIQRDHDIKKMQIDQKQQEILHNQSVDNKKLQLEQQKINAEKERTAGQLKMAKQKGKDKK